MFYKTPIDGKIAIAENIKENNYLKAGSLLGYVLPKNNKYFMETILPQNNFGKLDTCLHVQIRLDAYPYEEWGGVNGTISHISSVPVGNGFMATIKLDNGLVTNNQKRLIYRNGLRAQAVIITKDMRLLQSSTTALLNLVLLINNIKLNIMKAGFEKKILESLTIQLFSATSIKKMAGAELKVSFIPAQVLIMSLLKNMLLSYPNSF